MNPEQWIKNHLIMDLRKYEVIGSTIIWIGVVFYSIYSVIKASVAFQFIPDDYGDFHNGWLMLDRRKDHSDTEWRFVIYYCSTIYKWFIPHIVVSELLRKLNNKAVPYWQLLISILYITYCIGLTGLFLLCAQPILWNVVSKKCPKGMTYVWICGTIFLIALTFLKHINLEYFERYDYNQYYMVIIGIGWINLRCISYFSDTMNTSQYNILDLLWYCLYFPTLFLGPVIMFDDFIQCRNPELHDDKTLTERLIGLICSTVRFGFWFIFLEFALHFVYVNAMQYQENLVKQFDNWTLCGYGYCMGQYIQIKYVVMYGISTTIATFDHISSPRTPKCIGRIYLYSEMWKYFDVGLYKFLTKYIYIPSYNSSIKNKTISTTLVFIFVYVWHGISSHILVWAILNFLGIVIERQLKNVFQLRVISDYLNPVVKERLFFVVVTPIFVMSTISNFYFFTSMEIGGIFVEKILSNLWAANCIILFCLYTCCIVSSKIKTWETHKEYIYKK